MRLHMNFSEITHQQKLEQAYNVNLSESNQMTQTPSANIWTRRKESTDIESKISEILNKRDTFEGRPFHPLGLNRRKQSTQVQDIPFMNHKNDYKLKKDFNNFLNKPLNRKRASVPIIGGNSM